MIVPIKNCPLEQRAEAILRSLHINGTLKGLGYLTYAVSETVRDPRRTEYITKDLYLEIARAYGTTASRVERAMRWSIRFSWEFCRKELDQMAGYHLVKRPTNREFIDFVAFYIRSR